MGINFGMLNTDLPAQIGAMPANALAARRQRIQQDEDRAFQREGAQMQNTLARIQMTKAQRDMEAEDATRAALSGGGEWGAVVNRVRAIDPVRALDLESKIGAVQSAKASQQAAVTKQAWDKLQKYRDYGLQNVTTPQQYASWLHQQHTDPELAPVMSMLPPLEESLRTIPSDPAQFEQFRLKGMLGMQKWLEMNKPTDFERTLDLAGMTPEQKRAAAAARVSKETTHAPGTTVSFGAPVAAVDAQGNPVFIQPSKSGGAPAVIPGVRPPDNPAKTPTEAEAKAAFYAGNMRAASKVIDQLESQGLNMAQLGSQVETAVAGGLGNLVAGPVAQQARQAQNQWAEQMLRMQTGAAATADEIRRTVSTYFPQPGDSKQVVAQKRAQRAQAEQGVFAASGRAQGRVEQQGQPAAQAPRSEFDDMPNPAQYAGKVVTDTETGIRYRSNGKQWVRE